MPSIKLNGVSYTPLTIKNETSDVDIVTELNENSTDIQVPSAKAVYEKIKNIDAETLDGKHASEFLSVDGGKVNGNLLLGSDTEAIRRNINIYNTLRNMLIRVYENGDFKLYDMTNSKDVITSKADGTNTFNGTASGNLPLTGGTVGDGTIMSPITFKGKTTSAYTKYAGADGSLLGYLGFSAPNKPIYQGDDNVAREILHTGNIENYTGLNVPKTIIEFTNSTNWSIPNTNLETFYLVKNDWCFLHVVARCNVVASDENSTVFTGLPIPPFQVYNKFLGDDSSYEPCQLTIGTGGQMLLRGGTVGKDYTFTYTYPVA